MMYHTAQLQLRLREAEAEDANTKMHVVAKAHAQHDVGRSCAQPVSNYWPDVVSSTRVHAVCWKDLRPAFNAVCLHNVRALAKQTFELSVNR
jgi:hypothetical protein